MTRRDWLVLLMGVSDASAPLDPIRLQKGMFLLANEQNLPASEQYDFAPYDYGPFSSAIYADVEALVDLGLVEEEHVPGYSWRRYRLTPQGFDVAQRLADNLDERQRRTARWLAGMKKDVLTLSFRSLLNFVYERYPEYAKNSIFSG